MSLISTFYRLEGTLYGMPLIEERGFCTSDEDSLSDYESGRVELIPLPRAAGIIAKSLDGSALTTKTIEPVFGRYENCLQIGKTKYSDFAPTQTFGEYEGLRILSYQRTWVQLLPGS
jgi:hypothetical protein